MTKKDKPLIYVAETSKILSKIICSQLEKLDYEVRLFTDGYILLKELIKSTPNIIIADKNLETIDGGELCNIIKTGSSKNDILFILISIEDKVYDFWSDSKLANKSMSISSQNVDSLIALVQELMSYEYISPSTFINYDKKEKSKSKEKDMTDEEILTSWK